MCCHLYLPCVALLVTSRLEFSFWIEPPTEKQHSSNMGATLQLQASPSVEEEAYLILILISSQVCDVTHATSAGPAGSLD
jgi:hypothetical protein